MEIITLDDLDRQLAQCLGVDGRASFATIAEILGVSDQTVARRYRRLRAAGVLRVVGLPAKVDGASWFLRMRCVPGSGEAIAAALARRADTAWVQLLSGDTEVLCSLRGDPSEGTDALLARLPRSGRIVAVTAYSRLHMFTGGPDGLKFLDVLPAAQVAPLLRPTPGGRVEFGDLDDALFGALAVDGRAPYADLAAATGWSESTVRRRVDQLRDTAALYFDLELDMPTFGFRSTVWLWLSVPPSQPGGGRHRAGEVPRGRLRDGHHRARQPRGLRGLPVAGGAVRVPDREGRGAGRRGAGGDRAGHPHGQAGFAGRPGLRFASWLRISGRPGGLARGAVRARGPGRTRPGAGRAPS